jgi:hypothetical protein
MKELDDAIFQRTTRAQMLRLENAGNVDGGTRGRLRVENETDEWLKKM